MTDWKTIPKQTFLNENGQVGDCWRCCIAAVLGLDAPTLPHFVKDYEGSSDAETQRWLNERGFTLLLADKIYVPRFHGDPCEVPLISCGPSPRSNRIGQHHAVVTLRDVTVYDPHPSEAGLTAIINQYFISSSWNPNKR